MNFKDGEIIVIWRKLTSGYTSLWLIFKEGTNWRYSRNLDAWCHDIEPLLPNVMRAELLINTVPGLSVQTLEDAITDCTDAELRRDLLDVI